MLYLGEVTDNQKCNEPFQMEISLQIHHFHMEHAIVSPQLTGAGIHEWVHYRTSDYPPSHYRTWQHVAAMAASAKRQRGGDHETSPSEASVVDVSKFLVALFERGQTGEYHPTTTVRQLLPTHRASRQDKVGVARGPCLI